MTSHADFFRMERSLPPIGSTWQELDRRTKRTVKVVRYDTTRQRVRIHCLQTEKLTWARRERFNGKRGGYSPVKA